MRTCYNEMESTVAFALCYQTRSVECSDPPLSCTTFNEPCSLTGITAVLDGDSRYPLADEAGVDRPRR